MLIIGAQVNERDKEVWRMVKTYGCDVYMWFGLWCLVLAVRFDSGVWLWRAVVACDMSV